MTSKQETRAIIEGYHNLPIQEYCRLKAIMVEFVRLNQVITFMNSPYNQVVQYESDN